MRHLDLFSGIGGFALAASWVWGADHEIVSFCEIEPFAQKVLKKHWPDVPCISDVRNVKNKCFQHLFLLTGGFPCQDVSIANANPEGLDGERSGLWKEFFKCFRIFRPRYGIIENVPALTVRGLDTVISNLASIGYDAEWQIIPAWRIGALHGRERIWIIAYPSEIRPKHPIYASCGSIFDEIKNQETPIKGSLACDKERFFEEIRTSEFIRKSNGLPQRLDRVGALGNAIVPQVVAPIMQAIKDLEEQYNQDME